MIAIFESESYGRPNFIFFDENEKVIDICSRFSFYLNSSLTISSDSIIKYCQNLRLFLLHQKEVLPKQSYQDICVGTTSAAIQDYLWYLKMNGKEDSTVHTRDRSLRTFFSWLYSFRSGLNLEERFNPYKNNRLMSPAPYRQSIKFITSTELIDFMIQAFPTERMRVLIHFMFETGCRVSEACRVLYSDLPDPSSFPSEVMYLPMIIRGSKKRGGGVKNRFSLISRITLSRVFRYFNSEVKPKLSKNENIVECNVFRNYRGNPIKKKSITDLFYQRSLDLKSSLTRNYTPHMLRHGAALSILSSELGKDSIDKLLLVKTIFGHARIKSTEVYTNIPIDAIRKIRDLNSTSLIRFRYEEAEMIFEKTFLKSQR